MCPHIGTEKTTVGGVEVPGEPHVGHGGRTYPSTVSFGSTSLGHLEPKPKPVTGRYVVVRER